jgi:phosphoenolpyruvate synthase/pyruvate phosphate dikinase
MGQIKEIRVADKTVLTVRTPQGTAEQPVEESKRNERVLDDALAADLVRLGRRIEAHYGAPQDIEWCRDGDHLFIVQARPITFGLNSPEVTMSQAYVLIL